MTRFILIFSLAFSVALLITYHVGGLAAPIFQELLSAFVVIAMITGTISYALYAYIDGISKDVAGHKGGDKSSTYCDAINRLSELKKEILINAFSVVGLLVLERIAHGVLLIFPVTDDEPFNWPWACALSVRFACFSLSVLVAAIQFHGFIIASEYRSVISRGS